MHTRIKDEIHLHRVPFCTTKKYSIVVIKHPETKKIRVFAKGAPEVVLLCCNSGLTEHG
jgi:magnesium-transporting ATPase (P-type)